MKPPRAAAPAARPPATSPANPAAPAGSAPPPISLIGTAGRALGSVRLTVALLAFSIVLVFVATLDQANLGVWGIQEKWFRSWVVYGRAGSLALPIFPGGYAIGSLLLLNLLAAHFRHFRAAWSKTGIVLIHVGLLALLIGELLSGIWQEDYFLRLDRGETRNYAESSRWHELAVIDESDAATDRVTVVPETRLTGHAALHVAELPFEIVPRGYFANSRLSVRADASAGSSNGFNSPATRGAGLQVAAAPLPRAHRDDEGNLPSAYVELRAGGESLGTFLVSPGLSASQVFAYSGRRWSIALRPQRLYGPFALTLHEFRHDRYPGTEIPRNFSSRLRLVTPDGREDREALISMNRPLRHAGLTFYQSGFENADRTTVLQVVRNPSWFLPYVACSMMTAGLLLQFGLHLAGYLARRRQAAKAS